MSTKFLSRSARIRRSARARQSAPETSPPPRFPRPDAIGNVVHLVSFEITDEPMPDPRVLRLPEAERDRISEVGLRIHEERATVAECEELVARHPDIPVVYNYLANAYKLAGMWDKASETAETTFRRFPDYLFGVLNYVDDLMNQGRIEEVTAILNRRYSLHLWIRDRRRYHISEFVAFNALMVQYFVTVGERDVAARYVKMLKEGAPAHPTTKHIAEWFSRGEALHTLQKALETLSGK